VADEVCEIPVTNATDSEIKDILDGSRTIAVVGLSRNETRPSHAVARYLKNQGYRIIPVNPNADRLLGEKCYPGLRKVPEKVDVVDIFRRPKDVGPVVEDALAIGAKVVWMQEGIVNNEAAEAAGRAGLKVVMNKCIMKEHKKLSLA
jgi:predicted CoA-binding protein